MSCTLVMFLTSKQKDSKSLADKPDTIAAAISMEARGLVDNPPKKVTYGGSGNDWIYICARRSDFKAALIQQAKERGMTVRLNSVTGQVL